jgi:hypothetical protein
MQTHTTLYQRQKNAFFPENFLEKRVVHFLGFGNNTSPIEASQAEYEQNQKAEDYYKSKLEQANSPWNPIHLSSRWIRSLIARTIGKEGETAGKRIGTAAASVFTLGLSTAVLSTKDTLAPNAQDIVNKGKGAGGHLWKAGTTAASLPFSLAKNTVHATTSAAGGAGNLSVAASQAILGTGAGAANLISKPLAWVPGIGWINQKAKNGQDAMFKNAGTRMDRVEENATLMWTDAKRMYKDTKGTTIDGVKHLSQAAIYALSPDLLYNATKDPIESAAQTLKNSNLPEKIYTPTGKSGESWIQSDAGKKYQKTAQTPFPENNYTPTWYPPEKKTETPENISPEKNNAELSALTAQMDEIKAKLDQVLQAGPVNNTNSPAPEQTPPANNTQNPPQTNPPQQQTA